MTMLALERCDFVPADALIGEFERRFPAVAAKLPPSAIEPGGAPGGAFLIQFGETVVTVMTIDARLPAETLDSALQAKLTWPDVAERMAGNRAHAIVATMSDYDGHAQAVDHAGLVTLVTAALAALVPAIGVYWYPGKTATEAQKFQAYADGLVGGQAPTDVWVQLLFMKGQPLPSGAET